MGKEWTQLTKILPSWSMCSSWEGTLLDILDEISAIIVVVQSLSPVRLFATPWTAARQASLSFTISLNLLKLMSAESVMPSNHLILCRPLLLLPSIFPSNRVFSNESALRIKVAKVLELQLQHQSLQWIFRVDFLQNWLVWSPLCILPCRFLPHQHYIWMCLFTY